MQATVAICTFNGAARVLLVLEALARQTVAAGDWETLVIDNASTDGTGEVAARFIRESLGGRGGVVREERAGLSFARARAAQAAGGEVICFLDDDNIPGPDYVAAAIRSFAAHSQAGVIGGRVLADWEAPPSSLALVVQGFALAICDLGSQAKCLADDEGGGVVGAGMCVRRGVLRAVFGSSLLAQTVTDRKGGNLISGGDIAISVMARKLGWEVWYDPALVIKHLMPAARMEKNYLLRLYEGIGRGQFAVRKLYDWKARSPLAWLIGFKDYGRWLAGKMRGPTSALRQQHPEIAGDLHELNQQMTLGRACQALSWPRP